MDRAKLNQRRGELITQMRYVLDKAQQEKRELSKDEAADYDAKEQLVDTIERELDRQAGGRRGISVSDASTGSRSSGDGSEKRGLGESIREAIDDVRSGQRAVAHVDYATGCRVEDPEQRFIGTTTATTQGVVPLGQLPVESTLRAHSVILGLPGVRSIQMSSDRVRVPRIAGVDTTGATIVQSGVAENGTITSTDPDMDFVDLLSVKFGVVHTISSELVEDSTPDILSVVVDSALRELALKVDYGMLEGTGASNLVGIRNTPGVTVTNLGAAPADFDFLQALLEASETANANPSSFIMHPRSWRRLTKLKTGIASDKTLLLEPSPQDAARTLLGLPVAKSSQITLTEGTAGSWIAAVDASQLIVGERRPVRVEVSRDATFQSDSVMLKITTRVAFGVLNTGGVQIAGDVR